MGQNILITGGAGYIGGSLVAEFISRTSGPIKTATISTAVRTEEQVQSLSKLGINVIQIDLNNESAVEEAVLGNEIDIVVHTASSILPHIGNNLIKALGHRRKDSGEETYFIHTSVTTAFSEEGGWPAGEVRDTDPLFEKEKQIGGPHPVRVTDVAVVEEAKAQGVTFFHVGVPYIYGRGSGEWRKLSVSIPVFTRTSIEHRIVYKFDKDGTPPAAHISDLTKFYALLVEKILQKVPIPSGEKGYYFAIVHTMPWWGVMQRLAEGLHARGLVDVPKAQIWPSYEMAAEYLGWPLEHIRAMGTSSGQFVPVNAYRLGWQPKWDQKRFLENIDDEIQAVQELDTIKPSIFDSLTASKS